MTPVTDSPRTLLRTCPLCEAVCGLELTLDAHDHVTAVRGDHADPFSHGFICPKGASLGALDEDPDRLTEPMIRDRDTDEWRTATWAEAFALIGERLPAIAHAHGNQAVGVYVGNPNAHTVAGALYLPLVLRALGTRNIYSASTADQMPKQVASGLMFGDPLTVAVPDLDRTDYLLMLGANPLESNGSLCTAPDFPGRLKALRKRGGRFTVVDPRRTRTAKLADEHLFIRPGSDAYLLFGIVHTLFAEQLTDVRVEVEGLDEIRAAAADFTPDVVSARTGVPAATVARIARELAAAPTAAVYARIGTCTAEFGTVTQWLVDVVNVLTGNLDTSGGAMFATGAALGIVRSRPFRTGRWTSRVRELPEAMGELPVATLADEIGTPGDGQIRAMVTVAGNPVLSAPSGPRLDAAFAGLEFMVCVDRYLNETTRHADVILPPPRIVQAPHYDFALLNFAVRNYARYSRPLVPLGDHPSEAEILARLAMAVSGQRPPEGVTPLEAVDEMVITGTLQKAGLLERRPELLGENTTEQRIDMMLRLGPYGEWNPAAGVRRATGTESHTAAATESPAGPAVRNETVGQGGTPPTGDVGGAPASAAEKEPARDDTGTASVPDATDGGVRRDDGAAPSRWHGALNLGVLLEHPHGIDLGPLRPRLPGVLRTASRKVELAPPQLLADVRRLRARLRDDAPEMVLIGRRQLRSNNSWLHNVSSLVGGSNRCTLHIHPDDVARLGLNGQAVVKSAAGTVIVTVEPTEEIMPGVVSLPHGWGHADSSQAVARAHAGVNANVLTDDSLVDAPSGNAVFNGVPVTLTPA
ncbi:molybdopterin-dependent oxidoreductase [Nocardia otitidiscaviarum]|uniref:molybdopterin-dependent oxidoreductase n=1 Tax=Nocardia otitidiscaviarum TaxID=1823 RepID=UPI001FD1EE78|nr:molybdopterin-dependent oxidoreductase [Nocardia otitidiscaviarum]MCP9621817.1 molybdopterin-dependent oxidoreductase [Nocardia otitidiscaviarum]